MPSARIASSAFVTASGKASMYLRMFGYCGVIATSTRAPG